MFENFEPIELAPELKEKYDERLKKFAKDWCRLEIELIDDLYDETLFETDEVDTASCMQTLMGIIFPYLDEVFDEVIDELEAEGV